MFIINTEIEVNWFFPASVATYVNTDFDVIVKKPDGSVVYVEGASEPGGAIKNDDFIPSSSNTTGSVSYRLNPDQKGVWVVILTIGNTDSSNIYSEYFLRISEPDTHIYQQVTVQ